MDLLALTGALSSSVLLLDLLTLLLAGPHLGAALAADRLTLTRVAGTPTLLGALRLALCF